MIICGRNLGKWGVFMKRGKRGMMRTIAAFCSVVLLLEMGPAASLAETAENLAAQEAERGPASTTAVLLEEDQEIREENVKYFFRSDGNREAAVYQEPVHYQEDGTWKDIDNTLIEVETEDGKTAFRNKENDLKVTLPQTLASSEEVAVSYQDHRLSFRLKEDTPAAKARSRTAGTATLHQPSPCRLEELQAAYQNRKAETAGTEMAARPRLLHAEAPDIVSLSDSELADALNEEMRSLRKLNAGVTYSGVAPGLQVSYLLQGRKLKESLVFDRLPDQESFSFAIDSGELTGILLENGAVEFRDGETCVFTVQPPYMWDAAEGASDAIEVRLAPNPEGGYTYTLIPDRAWLQAEDRVYPVTLDPSVLVGSTDTIDDTTLVYGPTITQPVLNQKYLYVGNVHGTKLSVAVRAQIPQKVLESGRILEARLVMQYEQDNTSTKPSPQVNAYRLTSDWEDPGNKQILNAGNCITFDGTALDYQILQNHTSELQNLVPYVFDVTKAAQLWLSDAPNYGIVLEQTENPEALNYFKFVSSDNTDYPVGDPYSPTASPLYQFVYRDMTGLESYWSYTTASAGRAGSVYVNNYTGEATVTAGLSSTDHNRMPAALGLVYNGSEYNERMSAGMGWHLNYADVLVEPSDIPGYPYYLRDMDHTIHYFLPDNDGSGYVDEDGLGLKLSEEANGDITIQDKSGTTMHFPSSGLHQITDSNHNTLTLNHGYMQSELVDGAGMRHGLIFSKVNDTLSRVFDPANREISLGYNTWDQLTGITYPDGERVQYEYTSGRLSALQDVDGKRLSISYDAAGRVSTLTEYGADGSIGEKLTFDYTQARHTRVTDRRGRNLRYNFDMYGRVTDIADNEGYAHFYKMTPAAEDLSQPGVSPAMRNKLQLQSDLQKTTINYAFDLLGYFWTGTDVEGTPAAGSYANGTDNTTRFINRASHRSSINNLNGTSRMFVYSCGEVILEPGTYTFSAYVQTNFSGNSQNPDGGAKMQVDLGGGLTATAEPITRGDTGWTRQSVTFTVPSTRTVQMRVGIEDRVGTVWYNGLQIEKGEIANNVNLVPNAAFSDNRGGLPFGWNYYTEEHTGDGLTADGHFRVCGKPGETRGIWRETDLAGAGEMYVFSGWARADSVMPDSETPLPLRLVARVNYTDGTYRDIDVPFNPACSGEQFVSGMVDTRVNGENKPYNGIRIMAVYQNGLNTAEFWDLCLQQDAYGTSYAYDYNGNLISSVDQAEQQSSFTYSGADLSRLVEPTGNFALYAYSNEENNLMRTDTASGVSTTFEYDSYGNPTSASTFNHPFETAIYNNREYVLINKKSGMVMDICGVAEGEDRLGKRIIQYNNKRHIYQNFVVKPHPTNTACKMIEPVYQQEAYAGTPCISAL